MKYIVPFNGALWQLQKALEPLIGNTPIVPLGNKEETVVHPIGKLKKRKTSYHGKNLAPNGNSAHSWIVHLLKTNGGKMGLDRIKKQMSEYYSPNSWSGPKSILQINGIISHDKDDILHLLQPEMTGEQVMAVVREHNRQVKAGLK